MDKLVCDICGGKLIMQVGGVSKCDSCGMDYSLARMREKVQEMKIVGPIETVRGEAELERELAAVKQFTELGYYDKAIEKGMKLIDEFPHDYRCWWETACAHAKDIVGRRNNIPLYFVNLTYKTLRHKTPIHKTAIQLAEKLPDKNIAAELNKKWNDIWAKALPRIASEDCWFQIFEDTSIKYNEWEKRLSEAKHNHPVFADILDKGVANAKALDDAGIKVGDWAKGKYYDVRVMGWSRSHRRSARLFFIYGRTIITEYAVEDLSHLLTYDHQSLEPTLLTVTQVNHSVIDGIYEEIYKYESEYIERNDCCPNCDSKTGLNRKRSKCSGCSWKSIR